jgi:hypothetical protein
MKCLAQPLEMSLFSQQSGKAGCLGLEHLPDHVRLIDELVEPPYARIGIYKQWIEEVPLLFLANYCPFAMLYGDQAG